MNALRAEELGADMTDASECLLQKHHHHLLDLSPRRHPWPTSRRSSFAFASA
jgi:hypothetical protein